MRTKIDSDDTDLQNQLSTLLLVVLLSVLNSSQMSPNMLQWVRAQKIIRNELCDCLG